MNHLNEHKCIILQLIADVSVSTTEKDANLCNYIENIMEEIVSEIISTINIKNIDDVIITMDRIEVDCRDLCISDLQNLKKNIYNHIELSIKDKIQDILLNPNEFNTHALPTAKIEGIKNYLLKGYFNWWMPVMNTVMLETTYKSLLVETPLLICTLWDSIRIDNNAVKRFVTNFSLDTIKKTLRLLTNINSGTTENLTKDLLCIKANGICNNVDNTTFSRSTLASILSNHTLINSLGEYKFVEASIKCIANDLGIKYENIISDMTHQVLRKPNINLASNIKPILLGLHENLILGNNKSKKENERLHTIKQFDNILLQDTQSDINTLSTLLQQIILKATYNDLSQQLNLWFMQKPMLIGKIFNSSAILSSIINKLPVEISSIFMVLTSICAGTPELSPIRPTILLSTIDYLSNTNGTTYLNYLSNRWDYTILHKITTQIHTNYPTLKSIFDRGLLEVITKAFAKSKTNAGINVLETKSDTLEKLALQYAYEYNDLTALRVFFIKADVLNITGSEEKNKLIEEIFYDAAKLANKSSQFAILTMLMVAKESKLPKKEFLRKMQIILDKETNNILINNTQNLQTIFNSSGIVNDVDISLFNATKNCIEELDLSDLYQTKLLPELKCIMEQGGSLELITQNVDKVISLNLANSKMQEKISNLLKAEICNLYIKDIKDAEEAWKTFLLTGATIGHYKSINDMFGKIDRISPNVVNITSELSTVPHAIERLIENLGNKELSTLILLITENDSETLYTINRINHLLKNLLVTSISHKQLKNVWWQAALFGLLSGKFKISKTDWLKTSMSMLSENIGIDQMLIYSTLINSTELTNPSSEDNKITTLVKRAADFYLKTTLTPNQSQTKISGNEQNSDNRENFKQNITYLLIYGASALPNNNISLDTLESQFGNLLKQKGNALRDLLLSIEPKNNIANRLVNYFGDNILDKTIKLLSNGNYSWIAKFMHNIKSFSQITPAIDIATITLPKYTKVAILDYLVHKCHSPFNEREFIKNWVDSVKDKFKDITQLKLFLEKNNYYVYDNKFNLKVEVDVIDTSLNKSKSSIISEKKLEGIKKVVSEEIELKFYVENGGLVFIWPFIGELFEKLKLMKKHKFISKIAASNAVHALQYITNGSLNTPEWQLLLNKVLCGLHYNDVVFSQYITKSGPIMSFLEDSSIEDTKPENEKTEDTILLQEIGKKETEALKKACVEFLNGVLNIWTSLRSLRRQEEFNFEFTIENFQKYFLQRTCILQYSYVNEKTHWHITIPAREYDSQRIMPQWNLDKVSLPWVHNNFTISWIFG